jgi:hypothetical protein
MQHQQTPWIDLVSKLHTRPRKAAVGQSETILKKKAF